MHQLLQGRDSREGTKFRSCAAVHLNFSRQNVHGISLWLLKAGVGVVNEQSLSVSNSTRKKALEMSATEGYDEEI